MGDTERKPGDPYCTNCGYALTGAIESSKCPECGKPLVEVMDRYAVRTEYAGKRYRSTTKLFGLPLIDIAMGPVEGEAKGRAKGFIAIGDIATGWLALGGIARGVVAIGGMAFGGLALGGCGIGLLGAVGGMAIGLLAAGGGAIGGVASGGGAAGYIAQGGGAIGYYARGGGAFGAHTIAGTGASSQEAQDVFDALSWFYGTNWTSPVAMFQPMAVIAGAAVIAAGLLGLLAWLKWSKHGGGDVARFP